MEERVKVKRLSFSFFSADSFSILHLFGDSSRKCISRSYELAYRTLALKLCRSYLKNTLSLLKMSIPIILKYF
ncbi:hypothetical protein LEP1GSC036_1633 [Leptospira weilii str. 2006001853]|uniref:Uncharacterized protein n=2 Tax=Leptospira weilii TaxID=28184 RepID=A0A828YWV1_9LEPT|nr:hypothetical protein [Leptospira weilii]EKR62332.1 hypothetical protein LEP1GSC036_1633 [Leptospira weilii str. 2006001853]EMN90307.1 hypothetical protein LEP1GSC108_3532 [Leptospira weilii str. UI 13098]OMI18136.1 hypothetical protein BUQ74_06340 [Leptospira weilii serovar Heyan]